MKIVNKNRLPAFFKILIINTIIFLIAFVYYYLSSKTGNDFVDSWVIFLICQIFTNSLLSIFMFLDAARGRDPVNIRIAQGMLISAFLVALVGFPVCFFVGVSKLG